MDTLCADIGNFSVLTAVVGNKPASINKMRSLIVDVTHKGDVRDGLTADDSPLVEVKGKFFKLGSPSRETAKLFKCGRSR